MIIIDAAIGIIYRTGGFRYFPTPGRGEERFGSLAEGTRRQKSKLNGGVIGRNPLQSFFNSVKFQASVARTARAIILPLLSTIQYMFRIYRMLNCYKEINILYFK